MDSSKNSSGTLLNTLVFNIDKWKTSSVIIRFGAAKLKNPKFCHQINKI